MYLASKLPLSLTFGALFANHYYHHQHRINIALGLEKMPELPTIQSDPPEFKLNSNFEKKIDGMVKEIEHFTRYLNPQKVFDDFEYKGDFMLQDQQKVPHGTGAYETRDTNIIGNFEKGSLQGPFELSSKETDLVVKGDLQGEKMSGLAVMYSKGCKFEIDTESRNFVLTDKDDNKVYVQMMPGDYSLTKSYDKEGRKVFSEYKNKQGHAIREIFEEDGSKLTVEMKNGEQEGESIYTDKYGDFAYKEVIHNGKKSVTWSYYTEIGAILGISFLSTFWPRNPRKALTGMSRFWLRRGF